MKALELSSLYLVAFLLVLERAVVQSIVVYDKVLTPQACTVLHDEATHVGLSHRLFARASTPPQSALEAALDQLLHQLQDDSPFVEYWCRQEWRHIEAHADVDEYLAKTAVADDESTFRYPTHGHVLYLNVGDEVRGPTCLWPGIRSGGQLEQAAAGVDDASSCPLVTVPAVRGRLLRFDGDYLHAVPRPADLWMLSFVKGAPDYDSPEFQRSVVLFNTWHKDPPLQVPALNNEGDDVAVGIETKQQEASSMVTSDWLQTPVLETNVADDDNNHKEPGHEEEDRSRVKVWLLGDLKRRQHPLRTVTKFANPTSMKTALTDPFSPRCTNLFSQE